MREYISLRNREFREILRRFGERRAVRELREIRRLDFIESQLWVKKIEADKMRMKKREISEVDKNINKTYLEKKRLERRIYRIVDRITGKERPKIWFRRGNRIEIDRKTAEILYEKLFPLRKRKKELPQIQKNYVELYHLFKPVMEKAKTEQKRKEDETRSLLSIFSIISNFLKKKKERKTPK